MMRDLCGIVIISTYQPIIIQYFYTYIKTQLRHNNLYSVYFIDSATDVSQHKIALHNPFLFFF